MQGGGHLKRAMVLAVAIACGASALAQQPDTIENRFLSEIEPCVAASADTTLGPARLADICNTAAITLTQRMQRQQSLTPAEMNLYNGFHVIVMQIQASAIVATDKGSSPRACNIIEFAWKEVQKINPALNPEWSADLAGLREGHVGMVRECRRVHGTPAGAPPAF